MSTFTFTKHKQLDSYSISSVEQLTGIKAHTLRVWERRYRSLIPHRTDTNIRYYDDSQLKKILNISTLLAHGHKISNLSTYSDEKLNELLNAIFNSSDKNANDVHVNMLIDHMLAFDERAFDKVLSNAILRYGFYEAVIDVIFPFLRKTGLLWSTSNAAPSQEHFASGLVRRKLLAAIDGIPYPDTIKKKFILFLPPDEWHEIGLLLADYLIRKRGGESINLGQNVPYSGLKIAVERSKATHMITFLTTGNDTLSVLETLSELSTALSVETLVYTSGSVEKKFNNVTVLDSPTSIFEYI